VEDASGTGHGVVGLEMPVVVPGKRRHSLANIDAEVIKRMHQLLCPRHEVPEVVTVEDARRAVVDDLDLCVVLRRVVEQAPRI
jgi:hypothetical protein